MDIDEIKHSVKIRLTDKVFSAYLESIIYLIYLIAFPFNLFFYSIENGVAYYMIRFTNDKRTYISDAFRYIDDMWDFFWTGFLKKLTVFLHSLLLIVPGIIKHYEYSMVTMLLIDPKYNLYRGKECLELSKQMMQNHKLECFLLDLSFFLPHIASIFTFGLLEIYLLPYHIASKYKLLYDIKKEYTGEVPSFMLESDATYTPVAIIKRRKPKSIEVNRDQSGNFVAKYCMQCGRPIHPESKSCIYCGFIYEDQSKKEKDSE